MKSSWKSHSVQLNLLNLIPLFLMAWIMATESTADPVQAKWELNDVHTAQLLIDGTLPDLSDPAWVPFGDISVVGPTGAKRNGKTLTVPSPQPDKPWNAFEIYFQYNKYFESGGAFLGETFEIVIYTRHMVKGIAGTGHKDELEPSGEAVELFQSNLLGLSTGNEDVDSALALTQLFDDPEHTKGKHKDTGRLSIFDKNGKAPGTIGAERLVKMIALYQHPVPDTGASLGLLLGAFGMLCHCRGRRGAC